MHQSFLVFNRYKYLKIAGLITGLSILLYALHNPPEPANGGTWLGYTLGTIGAGLIVWLMLFGIRKRQYQSNLGSLRGWLSAHIYLGSSLLVIATLHSGGELGWNVHTLAYVLMTIVILSGFFGVFVYWRYPHFLSKNRNNRTRQEVLGEVAELDRQTLRLAQQLGPEYEDLVDSAINLTKIGGGTLTQLTARDESMVKIPASLCQQQRQKPQSNPAQQTVIDVLTTRLSQSSDQAFNTKTRALIQQLGMRRNALRQLRRDIQIQAILQIWLYIHIPLSFALLAALTTHIVAVFVYW